MDISIILPTYNEAEASPLIIQRILSLFPKNEHIEVIVVDDNSPDGTARKIENKFTSDIRVKVLHRKNRQRGLGNSIYDGIMASTGSIVVGLDADGNHPPKLIPILVNKINRGDDAAIASRFVINNKWVLRFQDFGSLIYNSIIRIGLGYPVWDNTSGYYAIKREVLTKLPLKDIFRNTYGEYHIRLMYALSKKGYTIAEIPVIYEKRIGGKSKSSLAKMLLKYLSEAIKWRRMYKLKYEDK